MTFSSALRTRSFENYDNTEKLGYKTDETKNK